MVKVALPLPLFAHSYISISTISLSPSHSLPNYVKQTYFLLLPLFSIPSPFASLLAPTFFPLFYLATLISVSSLSHSGLSLPRSKPLSSFSFPCPLLSHFSISFNRGLLSPSIFSPLLVSSLSRIPHFEVSLIPSALCICPEVDSVFTQLQW